MVLCKRERNEQGEDSGKHSAHSHVPCSICAIPVYIPFGFRILRVELLSLPSCVKSFVFIGIDQNSWIIAKLSFQAVETVDVHVQADKTL